MSSERHDRVALVSGANRGIGLAIARRLLARGYRLSLGVKRPDAVPRDLLPDSEGRLSVATYDARERDAGDRWVASAIAAHGRIDVLVNNAGIAPMVELQDGRDEDLDLILDVNVKGPFRVIRAALPHLKASGSGRVVNIASLSGKRVINLNTGYQMSKHAVIALTHAVRRLGWEHGIRATALCPGFVSTDMTAGAPDMPREAMSDPDDLAALAVTLIELPNNCAVAELLVNCRHEPTL